MNIADTLTASLFAPWERNGIRDANRLAVAPMTRVSATEQGVPAEAMPRYYERIATGGFGLVITEGVYTDQAYSQAYLFQPGLTNREQAEGWARVVNAVHAAGGKIFAQLMHGGALMQGNRFKTGSVGPSAVRTKGSQMSIYRGEGAYPMPRAMSESDIADVIEGFTRAARLALDVAGFDGIEIHGANGYLLDQFMTDYTNRRDDAWGGSIERRVRLSVEVALAMRSAIGTRVPLGMRISQAKVNDFEHKWAEGRQGAAFIFGSLAAAQVLGHGADLVALRRGALANPNSPKLVAEGRQPKPFDRGLLSPLGDLKSREIGG